MSTSIHQELVFQASPNKIYEALLSSDEHSSFTGKPAQISRDVGGEFSCHGGALVGRNIELIPDQRIIQAWRVAAWDSGVYSIVRIELDGSGSETVLSLDHTGFPDGAGEHLEGGWHKMYWEPLKDYLAA